MTSTGDTYLRSIEMIDAQRPPLTECDLCGERAPVLILCGDDGLLCPRCKALPEPEDDE